MSQLPIEILEKIAYESGIDACIALKVKPKKLDKKILERMNILLRRKFDCQCINYKNTVSTLNIINKNTYLYIGYNFNLDIMNFVFLRGILNFGQDNFVFFPSATLESGTSYYISDIFNPNVDLSITRAYGFGTKITPYNWVLIS
jgi:hypothetical protein